MQFTIHELCLIKIALDTMPHMIAKDLEANERKMIEAMVIRLQKYLLTAPSE